MRSRLSIFLVSDIKTYSFVMTGKGVVQVATPTSQ